MAPAKSTDPMDLVKGGVLQCMEAITVGMPFEVWKTRMGSYRNESTIQSFRNIYKEGGVGRFWVGWQPKLVESFLKGGILLFAKDGIIRFSKTVGLSDVLAGLVGGFGGGVAQVVVLGPCTYLVTAAVAGDKNMSLGQRISDTFSKRGISGFYQGGTALMLRQGSNWASRQGITDFVRNQFKNNHKDPKNAKLSVTEEALSGIVGGALSTWNQPFEVMRIEAQAAAAKGMAPKNIFETTSSIVKENGVSGLFKGIIPRCGLCVGQTLFMVTLPYILKSYGM